jgi:LuxR family transcriptional regulator, maltose regulon positive regulatory protein
LPDGDTTDGLLAYLRALLCRQGIAEMRRDAQIAWDGLSPTSPYRATMRHTEGVSYLLEGDPGRADPVLAHAFDAATAAGAAPLVALVLAERAIAASETADWPASQAFTEQALAIVRNGEFDDYWTSALVYARAARIAARHGDVARARQHVTQAARLRPLLTYALPVVSAQALIEMGWAYLALGDPSGVRAVLRQAQDIFEQRPDLGVLPQQAADLRAKLGTATTGPGGASSLTTAELRLLPLLSTHLTLEEISERLYVSRNTVKTQAISVYRKFGVSSRRAAIIRMHELGLLSPN